MPTIGSLDQWATSSGVSLASGGQTPIFTPNLQPSKQIAPTRALHFELTGSGTASAAAANVQGLLGSLATVQIKDKNGLLVVNWTGPQIAYWYFLKTGKALTNPSVSAAGAGPVAAVSLYARIPKALPKEYAPYTISVQGAPYGEVASNLSAWSVSLTVYQEYGPCGPLMQEDYISLTGLTASAYDITSQLSVGFTMNRWAFVLNADTDLTNLYLKAGSETVYNSVPTDYFVQAAFGASWANIQSSDNRPAGLIPIPLAPYARGTGDQIKPTFATIAASADPHSGVNLGSAYNPYAILYEHQAYTL